MSSGAFLKKTITLSWVLIPISFSLSFREEKPQIPLSLSLKNRTQISPPNSADGRPTSPSRFRFRFKADEDCDDDPHGIEPVTVATDEDCDDIDLLEFERPRSNGLRQGTRTCKSAALIFLLVFAFVFRPMAWLLTGDLYASNDQAAMCTHPL
ncbi:uncharacterized protein A4U43_C06F9380 [Asparagus officinalis]|uniref:Uncharacterized protein n=1 Tax=Asparagus officinalis TaxID=4686 RepID=A0A5P1EKQ0_ASPOF|nr:uncharacterized protein A4U43_C06F9380 [Asparagus officinalis]